MQRRLAFRPSRLDLVLVALIAVWTLVGTSHAAEFQSDSDAKTADAWAYTLIVIAVLSLLWRRTAPLATLTATVAAVSTYLAMGYPFGPIQLCMVIAVFTVGRRTELRISMITCGAATVTSLLSVAWRFADELDVWTAGMLAWTAWIILPWAIGSLLQVRAAAIARGQEELVAQATLDERTRLAREVHDIAGHGFAVVAMQAGVALHVFERQPEQARESLEAIRSTSTQALDELRATLDTFGPRPGGDIHDLVARVRSTGLRVDADIDIIGLPHELANVAHRVVQEALTNVLRHSNADAVLVRVGRNDGNLHIDVTDNGKVPPIAGFGRGLSGMRSRIESINGSLDAGPASAGGFGVHASIPLEGDGE